MNLADPSAIIRLIETLNKSGCEYILLRNICNELPFCLEEGKDIDVLVHWLDRDKVIDACRSLGMIPVRHPHANDTFLYGARKFDFLRGKQSKIFLDIHYQLACRSLNAGEWIPLDQDIQVSVWHNKQRLQLGGMDIWVLGNEDLLVSLIVRSVFDKQEFTTSYAYEIERLIPCVGRDDVLKRLELVFFGFAVPLWELIENRYFDRVIDSYLTYCNY